MKDLTKAATPIECVQKGGDPNKTVVWACGSCHYSKSSREEALECCSPNVCDSCGQEYKSYCEPCTNKKRFEQEKAVYDKAKKVPYADYGGDMLYCEHCENFFPDADSFMDGHQEEEEPPSWAWATEEKAFRMNAEDVLYSQLEREEMHEEAFDNIGKEALSTFQAMLDAWTATNEIVSYFPDYSVVVDLDKEVERELAERKAELPEEPK